MPFKTRTSFFRAEMPLTAEAFCVVLDLEKEFSTTYDPPAAPSERNAATTISRCRKFVDFPSRPPDRPFCGCRQTALHLGLSAARFLWCGSWLLDLTAAVPQFFPSVLHSRIVNACVRLPQNSFPSSSLQKCRFHVGVGRLSLALSDHPRQFAVFIFAYSRRRRSASVIG